jgi:hypothetical protein
MIKNYTPFLILLTLSISYSCKKAQYDYPGELAKTTSAPADTSKGYSPVTANSYIKYRIVTGTGVDTTTNTATGTTTTINNKLYSVVAINSLTYGTSPGYYSNINHVYTARATDHVSGVTLELEYLVDNIAVGATWTAPVTDNGTVKGYPAQILGKITGKNISKTVSGIPFNEVTHTTLQLQYDVGGGFITLGSFEYYIAKGIGIIEIDSSVVIPGSAPTNSVSSVIAYNIK